MIALYAGLGGGIGALARFLVGAWLGAPAGVGFPWGTFAVNTLGCVLLGFIHRAFPAPAVGPSTRAFLTIGLCGGFTTFSTFDYDTMVLLRQGEYLLATGYSLGTLAACLAGVWGGMVLGAGGRRVRLGA